MVEKMRIREGYKKTEVGVIPGDWDVVSFETAFKFLSSGSNSRNDLRDQGTTNYIHYGDIHTKWDNILDCDKENIPFIDSDKVKRLPRLEDGDLVLADASEDYEGIGKAIEVKNIMGKEVVSGLHTFLLRGDKSIFADGFKGYIQEIKSVKNDIIKITTGISVYGISKRNIRNILIPVPTLEEQKAIAKALTDTDNLIDSIENLIDKKEKIKQGTMQELLTGKKRLDGFSGEWEIKKLGDIGDIVTGNTPPTTDADNYGGDFLFAGPGDLGINKYVKNTEKRLSNKGYALARRYPANSILITCIGSTIGKIGVAYEELSSNQQINAIIPNNTYSSDFMYYALSNISYKIKSAASEQAVPIINKSTFGSIEILVPKLNEQQAISQILSNMDLEIDTLKEKQEKYKQVKQGMMQELLTGRIRLI